ncbi:MAG: serine hydrolase domain-containing protein [Shimia sp.]
MDDIVKHLCDLTARGRHHRYLEGGIAFRTAATRRAQMVRDGAPWAAMPRMRVASISKMVTALTACSLAIRPGLDLATRAHVLVPQMGLSPHIRLHHLLTHTSGLRDDAGYIFDPPESAAGALHAHHEPGEHFHYANINYILLGQALEFTTNKRFDLIAREHVLGPAGVGGGFNWAGVSVADRANRVPMRQRQRHRYVVEADGDDWDWAADSLWRGGQGRSLHEHRLGLDAAYLSPHAGLRASVAELADLAFFLGHSAAGDVAQREGWIFDGTNGATGGGLFLRYGHGVSITGDHPDLPPDMVGHAGHALGFTGGAWFNKRTETAWAYVLTGSADETEGEDDEVFYPPEELAILQAFDAPPE